MNCKQRVLAALRLEQPDMVPFVETRVDPPLQEALLGKRVHLPDTIGGMTNLGSVELNEVLGFDNLQVRFLPPIFAEFETVDGTQTLVRPLIQTRDHLDRMVFPDPEDPALYAEAEQVIEQGRDKYAIGATLRSGVSATCMSMGLEQLAYALVEDPDLVTTVAARYADWAIAVIRHLRDIGVDFVWTADDIAYKQGPMISPRMFRDVFLPEMARVADAIHDEGFLWILHSDGNVLPLMEDLLSLGIHGLHPIEPGAMDIEQVKDLFGHRVCLVGNIDLRYTLTRGTPEEVEKEVKSRIERIGKGGAYMISSANSLTAYCKADNVRAMIHAIHQYRRYPLEGEMT